MNKWTSFFKNKKNRIVLTIVLVVAVSVFSSVTGRPQILSAAVNRVTVPVGQGVAWARNGIRGVFERKDERARRIAQLEGQVADLQKQLIDDTIRHQEILELKQLKEALQYKDGNRYEKFITTTVIGENDGNYSSTILLSAGEKAGIQKHSVVVTQDGLVGVVYETQDYYSKAYSLLHSKLSISIEVLRDNKIQGIASQNIFINTEESFDGFLKGYLFDKDQEIFPGDKIITSSVGMYAHGIPVGEVDSVLEDQTNLLKYIKIKPFASFKNLEKVMVYIPKPEKDELR